MDRGPLRKRVKVKVLNEGDPSASLGISPGGSDAARTAQLSAENSNGCAVSAGMAARFSGFFTQDGVLYFALPAHVEDNNQAGNLHVPAAPISGRDARPAADAHFGRIRQ